MDSFLHNPQLALGKTTLACVESGYCAMRVLEEQAVHPEWRENDAWETVDQAREDIRKEFPDVQFVSRADFQTVYARRRKQAQEEVTSCERLESSLMHEGSFTEVDTPLLLQQYLSRMGTRYVCTPVAVPPGRVRIETPTKLPDGDILDLFVDRSGDWLTLSDAGEALGFLLLQTAEAQLPPQVDAWVSDICTGNRVERKGGTLVVRVRREESDVVEAVQRLIETVLYVTALRCLLLPSPAGHYQEGD